MRVVLQPKRLHALARSAFEAMEQMAVDASYDTKEFNERQYVFELGTQLADGLVPRSSKLWTAYEYRYPKGTGRSRHRCDIVVWRHGKRTAGTFGWIEVKSTGLDDSGNWDNRFSALGWKHDVEKLRSVASDAWGGRHERAWVWLYQFGYSRHKVESLAAEGEWVGAMVLADMADIFGSRAPRRITLGSLLRTLGDACPGATASLRPHVKKGRHADRAPYAALLVTAPV